MVLFIRKMHGLTNFISLSPISLVEFYSRGRVFAGELSNYRFNNSFFLKNFISYESFQYVTKSPISFCGDKASLYIFHANFLYF